VADRGKAERQALDEWAHEQKQANEQLQDALSSWHKRWGHIQEALEMGADISTLSAQTLASALQEANEREIAALEARGVDFTKSPPHLLAIGAGRVGRVAWLLAAEERIEPGDARDRALRAAAQEAARHGHGKVIEAIVSLGGMGEGGWLEAARSSALGARWKVCASVLASRGAGGAPEWRSAWALALSCAAGRASEEGLKRIARAARESGAVEPGQLPAEHWFFQSDPLAAAGRARNESSALKIVRATLSMGASWARSQALPNALAEQDGARLQRLERWGVDARGHEGECGLGAARSLWLPMLKRADALGARFDKPAENGREAGVSALDWLANYLSEVEDEGARESLEWARSRSDELALRETLAAPAHEKPAATARRGARL
jgi:hypothetical protein